MSPAYKEAESAPRTAPATRWRPWTHRPRPALYLDATTGQGITNDGAPFTCAPGLSLRELVEALPTSIEAVYLCGALPEAPQLTQDAGGVYSPFNSWLLWAEPEQVRTSSGATHDETFARVGRSDGRLVEVRTIAGWLGTNDCTPQAAYDALCLVFFLLRRQHSWESTCLLSTPGLTGAELWRCSIGWSAKEGRSLEYPILPEDVRSLIHHTSGQGRFELLPPPASGVAPALVYLDGRFAYVARCISELGVGPVTHDRVPTYEGFTPARYRVRFTVPDNWAHVGILKVPMSDGERWEYPRTPGATGETWADASEMRIACAPFPHACPTCRERYQANDGERCPEHSWALTLLERLIFTRGRPLRTWVEKLIAIREACGENALARAAVRNIALHAIGRFHRTHPARTHVERDPHAVPDRRPVHLAHDGEGNDLFLWGEPGVPPRSLDYERPEWSAQVWARERAHLLLHWDNASGTFTGALTLPYEQVVAFRLDALYLTCDPGWPDNGKLGSMRTKGTLAGPVPWPREETDLAAIKAQLEGGRGS